MASGWDTIGHFQTMNMTAKMASITSHTSRSSAKSGTSISINGATAQSYSNLSSYLSDYYIVIRNVDSGHQHCLISRCTPNDSTVIAMWNQSDNAQTPTYTINGLLIPKVMCADA